MIITKELLKEHSACTSGYEWYLEQGIEDAFEIFDRLKKEERFDDLNWILTRMMTKEQCVMYAIYSAELVIDVFEKKSPDNHKPRKAIEAAKECLKNPSEKNKKAARAAAGIADWAAAGIAARAAAGVAAEAAMRLNICNYGIDLLKKSSEDD